MLVDVLFEVVIVKINLQKIDKYLIAEIKKIFHKTQQTKILHHFIARLSSHFRLTTKLVAVQTVSEKEVMSLDKPARYP